MSEYTRLLEQVKVESEGRRKALLEKAEALREAEIKVMNLEAGRTRLAAEVATLRESLERRDIELKEALDQIAREQSETRALVHRHVEERSALQREVVRLTAQWERLFGNLRDRRLTLFGYSAEQQVAIEDVFTAAVELMAALEREED